MERESWKKIKEDTIDTVQFMQDYIKAHVFDDNFSVENVYDASCYSERHCERMFKELTGKTILEYVRHIRLTESALELLKNDNQSVLEVAISLKYNSHEGFTRAFSNEFGVSPNKYRKNPIAIPLFTQYPVKAYYSYINKKENNCMSKETLLCMVTPVRREKRKLIIMRSVKANDYWTYCEEIGCDWEGLFNSIPEKMDSAAILELPDYLVKEGTSKIASGVEVPFNYNKVIPQNCEIVELEPCDMLYFQTEPYEKEEDFDIAIKSAFNAVEKYDAKRYGYKYEDNLAPKFNFGTYEEMGAKLAIPVRKI